MISNRKLLGFLLLWAFYLPGIASGARDALPVQKTKILSSLVVGNHLSVAIQPVPEFSGIQKIIVAHGIDPIGWFETSPNRPDEDESYTSITLLAGERPNYKPADMDAWVISPQILAQLRAKWPPAVDQSARIDDLAIGGASVWIDAGQDYGISVHDCWWRRVGGQPVARYDVRYVGQSLSLCRIVPLVSDNHTTVGQHVVLWPSPGMRRIGRAVSAVSFVENYEGRRIVWVPKPPRIETPAEPRVDFHRDGDYVGYGIAEKSDDRFYYVRLHDGVSTKPVTVGDDAIFRTIADIRNKRITARVFEQTEEGALINAGEIDGLASGDVGTVYRDRIPIGRVQLQRVQRAYSTIRLLAQQSLTVSPESTNGPVVAPLETNNVLKKLDTIRFRDPPPKPLELGKIEKVVDGTLFVARVDPSQKPSLPCPIPVHRADRAYGLAILLRIEGEQALGFVQERTLTLLPCIGDRLGD